MATHSSVLAWRISGTGEPGGLPSTGSHKSRTPLKRLSSSSRKNYWEIPWTEGYWDLRHRFASLLDEKGK